MVHRPKTMVKTQSPSLLKQLLTELRKGIKELGKPKGIVSLATIILSVLAFVRTAYVVTTLSFILNKPIRFEEMIANSEGRYEGANAQNFELFISSQGTDTIYLSKKTERCQLRGRRKV